MGCSIVAVIEILEEALEKISEKIYQMSTSAMVCKPDQLYQGVLAYFELRKLRNNELGVTVFL